MTENAKMLFLKAHRLMKTSASVIDAISSCRLRALLGARDGLEEGDCDGADDGTEEGTREGLEDREGPEEGTDDGKRDGIDDGLSDQSMFRDFDLSLTYTILKVSFDKWVCLFRNWGSALHMVFVVAKARMCSEIRKWESTVGS